MSTLKNKPGAVFEDVMAEHFPINMMIRYRCKKLRIPIKVDEKVPPRHITVKEEILKPASEEDFKWSKNRTKKLAP